MSSINKNKTSLNIRKPVWNILGSIFVGTGVIGIFIPLLPTTPFLLLAAYCFSQGSDRMYNWFKNNRLIGSYMNNYREKRGISLRAKMNSIFILWITIGISIYFMHNMYVRMFLVLVIVGVTIHLIRIPTFRNK